MTHQYVGPILYPRDSPRCRSPRPGWCCQAGRDASPCLAVLPGGRTPLAGPRFHVAAAHFLSAVSLYRSGLNKGVQQTLLNIKYVFSICYWFNFQPNHNV
jgi:hypothetical protein